MPKQNNPFSKRVTENNPYAIYVDNRLNFEYRVLKTYQRRDKENNNDQARWHFATKSPFTYGNYEFGDAYIRDILPNCALIECTDEWAEHYGN
jgi:hypothetical protein